MWFVHLFFFFGKWCYPFFAKKEQKPFLSTITLHGMDVCHHFLLSLMQGGREKRQCNYSCGFCFHTAKTGNLLDEEEAKRGLTLLANSGMRKLNFAGGEPFLYAKFLGKMAKYCKEVTVTLCVMLEDSSLNLGWVLFRQKVLKLESVSVVTNGSKLKDSWFRKYGHYIDIVAVSCDSCDDETNKRIGRAEKGSGAQLEFLRLAAQLCKKYAIKFKINTVVNAFNCHVSFLCIFVWGCRELPLTWTLGRYE